MDMKQMVTWLLGLDIVKGSGTYVIGGLMILCGVVGSALGLVDPVTGTGWIAGGYGLIRARAPTAALEVKVAELEKAAQP
jgi:hypothetical protein